MIAGLYERYVFTRMLDVATRAFRGERRRYTPEVLGRVLEIGIGTGASLAFYTEAVSELVGIEPSAELLNQCRAQVQQGQHAPAKVVLEQQDAQRLPYPDASFDSVLAFLVFCTIPDPTAAMREIFRVLKPGGRLVFFEHVRAPTAGMVRWQRRLNPLWKRLACGCQLTRDTASEIVAAGFEFDRYEAWRHPKMWFPLVASVIGGVALKPRDDASGLPVPGSTS